MRPDPAGTPGLLARLDEIERRLARLEEASTTRAELRAPAPAEGVEPPPHPRRDTGIPATGGTLGGRIATPPPGPRGPGPSADGWSSRPVPPVPALPARPGAPGASTDRPGIDVRELEERFGGRALAWGGGLALVGAAIFFLSLAFSRGWIDEPMRVAVGLAGGASALAIGGLLLGRPNRLVARVVTASGIGILAATILAATRLYGLVPVEVGLAGALALAAVAAALAVRYDARGIAALGLGAALAAPPIVGATATPLTLAFLASALAGTTAVALLRTWRWLPPLAFALTAPQLAAWIEGSPSPDPLTAVAVLAGYASLQLVAAAGEEVRVDRDDLRPASAGLVVVAASFLVATGFAVLEEDVERWRGTFTLLAAAVHLGVGTWFLARRGAGHAFGNLVAATGVGLLALGTFAQLGAAAVPIAWAAEGLALAWVAVRRRNGWAGLGAAALATLAVGHLLLVAYPVSLAGIDGRAAFRVPFVHEEAATLAAVLGALLVAALLVPVRWVRATLVAVAILVATHAATLELRGAPVAPALAAVLLGLAVLALVADRILERAPDRPDLDPFAGDVQPDLPLHLAGAPATVAGVAVVARGLVLGPAALPGATTFAGEATIALLVGIAGLAAIGILAEVRWTRSALAATAIGLVALAGTASLTGTPLVALLAALLVPAVISDRGIAGLTYGRRHLWLARGLPPARFATAAGIVAWLLAVGVAGAAAVAERRPFGAGLPAVPFADQLGLRVALLATAGFAAARWGTGGRAVAALAVLGVVAAAVPFAARADLAVVIWLLLGGVAMTWRRLEPLADRAFAVAGVALIGLATGTAYGILAVPARLVVHVRPDPLAALPEPLWPLAFAALAATGLVAARLDARRRALHRAFAGMTAVYGASIGAVAVFQGMTGGPVAAEELAKQAQVALSVLWTGAGVVALVAGLAGRGDDLRHGGFALLALATAKVLVVDLATMDVAYRALVLAGLGLLLLAAAVLVTRGRGPRPGRRGLAGGARPAG